MRIFKFIALVSFFFLFTASSCMVSTKKIDKRIGQYYGNTVPTKGRKSDFINFKFENTISDSEISSTEKTKGKVVPALFYWKWDMARTATLNTMMPMSNFTSSFITEVNAKGLKEKINGASIDIIVKENPSDFHLRYQGWLVYLLLAYVKKEKFYVDPALEQFSIAYTVNYTSGQKKSGELSVRNINKEKAPRFFQSFKAMVAEYLAASDANIKLMAKELAGKLIAEVGAD
jgi:hypothetical protein